MRNKLILVSLILIAILSICTISLGFSIDMEMDKTTDLKANDEVILILNLSEQIVGASFKINYDISNLQLVVRASDNFYVSENNGQAACVYIDMEDNGTDTLEIKFKVLNTDKTDLEFSLDEAKFITLENQDSYAGTDIVGISKTITIEPESDEDTDTDEDDSNNEDNTDNDDGNDDNIDNDNNDNNTDNDKNDNNNDNGNNNSNNNNNNSNSNSNNKQDNTTVKDRIPQTGTNDIIFVLIGITALIAVYSGIKLKKISK